MSCRNPPTLATPVLAVAEQREPRMESRVTKVTNVIIQAHPGSQVENTAKTQPEQSGRNELSGVDPHVDALAAIEQLVTQVVIEKTTAQRSAPSVSKPSSNLESPK